MTREHAPAGPCTFEITAFTKHGGPLTKRVRLDPSGKMISDGSACIMSYGAARRVRFDSLNDFAEFVGSLRSNEAIAVGALRPELPDNVEITTKRKLNGAAQPGLITRASDHIIYRRAGLPLRCWIMTRRGCHPPSRPVLMSWVDTCRHF